MKINNVIEPGKTISFFGHPYRILAVTANSVIMIEMGIDRYHFETLALEYIMAAGAGKIREIEDIHAPKHVEISSECLEEITEKSKFIEKIIDALFPEYEQLQLKTRTEGLKEYQEKFGCALPTVHKDIRRYLQSGRDMYSLVDRRTVENKNRKKDISSVLTENDLKHFEEAFCKFKNGDVKSVAASFRDMIKKYYSDMVRNEEGIITECNLFPKELRPSEKQYQRYVNEQLGNLTVAAFKKGAKERRNSDRIKFGTAQTGCMYPGDIIEIDACELDIILLSETYRKNGIGRPVVYFAVDVFSCCIVGSYVGFENNSFLGASSLFANLMFGEDRHLRKDGINITPGGIVPNQIRVDHGSEWISKNIRRVGKECGFDVTIVPPAMGSLKGIVENSFHVYQEGLRNVGREYGAIYQEYESKHYETASLMLKDIKKDIEDFVIMFNQKYRDGYTLSKEMIQAHVRPVPCELWDYGIKYCGNPVYVTEKMKLRLLYSLCNLCDKEMKPYLSMQGVSLRGLKYISREPIFISLMEKKHFGRNIPEYEVRYDPKLVDFIWVKIEDDIIQVPLAEKNDTQLSFKGLTWFEYNTLYQHKLELKAEYKQKDLENELLLETNTIERMKRSKTERQMLPGKNNKKNIKEIRKLDQQEERRRTALVKFTGLPEQEMLPEQGYIPEPEEENDGYTEKPKELEDWF